MHKSCVNRKSSHTPTPQIVWQFCSVNTKCPKKDTLKSRKEKENIYHMEKKLLAKKKKKKEYQ